MGAWEVGQLVIYEKTMQPFFISSNQQPSLLACDLFHRLLGDEESHVVPQSFLEIARSANVQNRLWNDMAHHHLHHCCG